MVSAPVKTILVIRSSAMGDVAMAVPVLKAFAKHYKNVRVIMLTNHRFKPMFDPIANVALFPIDLNGKHKGVLGICKLFKEIKTKYNIDAVIDLHDKLYSKLLCRLFKIFNIPAFKIDKGRVQKKELTAHHNKQLLQLQSTVSRYAQVFELASFPFKLNAHENDYVKEPMALSLTEFFPENKLAVALAPFASFEGKTMPPKLIDQTAKLLLLKYPNLTVFILGGSDQEKEIAEQLQSKYSNCISLVQKISLKDEINLLAYVKATISMDSGAMHLASIVGTPVVSVFGATHPYAGFLGFNQNINDAVQLNMNCRPCSVYGNKKCRFNHLNCLNDITPNMIVDKLSKYLNEYNDLLCS